MSVWTSGVLLTQVLPEPWQIHLQPRPLAGLACGALFAAALMALAGANPFLYLQY